MGFLDIVSKQHPNFKIKFRPFTSRKPLRNLLAASDVPEQTVFFRWFAYRKYYDFFRFVGT